MGIKLVVNAEDKTSLISYLNEVERQLNEGFSSGYVDSDTNWDLKGKLKKVI